MTDNPMMVVNRAAALLAIKNAPSKTG